MAFSDTHVYEYNPFILKIWTKANLPLQRMRRHLLSDQAENRLRQLVRLREHGGACLNQDAVTCQLGGFLGDVHIELTLEARGHQHLRELADAVRAAGFAIRRV